MSELREKKLPRGAENEKNPSSKHSRHKQPHTEEELAERAKSKKLARKIVITLAISCAVLLGLNLLSYVDFDALYIAIFGEEELDIKFEEADFEEDILSDPTYTELNRQMALKTGGQIIWIPEDAYGGYDAAVNRMHEYFTAAILGDLNAYNDCFTEDYLDDEGERTEPFTMQRIYGSMIEQIGQIFETEDGKTRRLYYLVEYKIQKNNGTFRDDVGSDGTKPQVFELILNTETGECKIDKITLQRKFKGVPVQEED